nr:PREDICTED: aminopeptidase N-like [Tribolium castaneum]|eukprot:XP_015840749.1 PREDICTED: aminopeptidase N-like [Tribolium castaneum]
MKFLKWLWFTILIIPTDQKKTDKYRLPEDSVKVAHYDVKLFLKNDIFATNAFTGMVKIQFESLQNSTGVKLHANGINFTKIVLYNASLLIELEEQSFKSDPVTDILTIRTNTSLEEQTNYVLKMEFKGKLRVKKTDGFHKTSYMTPNGSEVFLAATQFEPISARKAFPCFDEPSYKATFNITIRHPTKYKAVSNTAGTSKLDKTDGSYTVTTFEQTPVMSTYLVAFVVSDFACNKGLIDESTRQFFCSKPEAGSKFIQVMEKWSKIKRTCKSKITKLDRSLLPPFDLMENRELVAFREMELLWAKNMFVQVAKSDIVYEVIRMWFGNIVTTHWWSDIFLNEGLALYFQYLTTGNVKTGWEVDKQFVGMELQAALAIDSSPTAQALSKPVSSQQQILSRFNVISTTKGASIFHMMAYFMGTENFQDGIRKYLSHNKFGNTKPKDLWIALNATAKDLPQGRTLDQVMKNWIIRPGYPTVIVKSEGLKIIISQQRFLTSGKASRKDKWYVPISYTVPNDTNKFGNGSGTAWLLPTKNLVLPNVMSGKNNCIVLNINQTGYYRVYYDGNLWDRIKIALTTAGFGGISELNRAQIIDDYYNFAKIGVHPYSDFLKLLGYLKNETSYYPWYSALNAIARMLSRTESKRIRIRFSQHILNLMDTFYHSVPYKKAIVSEMYSLKQNLATHWACRLGLQECVNNAVADFKAYQSKKKRKINKYLKAVFFCTGLKLSTDPENDFNYVWNEVKAAKHPDERATLALALACVRKKTVLNKYLNLSINRKLEIKHQDALSVLTTISANNRQGIDVAFDFLLNHYKEIIKLHDGKYMGNLFSTLANKFTRKEQTDKLSTFLETTPGLPKSLLISARAGLTKALSNLKWTQHFESELANYFAEKDVITYDTDPTFAPDKDNSGTTLAMGIVTHVITLFLLRYFK